MDPLAQLGLSTSASRVYQSLLDIGTQQEAHLEPAALGELVERELVSVRKGDVSARSPRRILDSWLDAREAELRADREQAQAFMRAFDRRPGGGRDAIEMVHGREAVGALFFELINSAREEVTGFDRAPYTVSPPSPTDEQAAAMSRGVHFRIIYDGETLRASGDSSMLYACIAAGEEVRVLNRLPMKLLIADRSRAMIALPSQGGGTEAVLVRSSLPMDGLNTLFDQMWDLALPVSHHQAERLPESPVDVDDGTRALLALMSLGVTDEAIARDLGISVRTLQRRVAQLQRTAGVATRFQLGVQAARLGWF